MLRQHLPLVLVTLALGISLLMLQRQVASLREQLEGVAAAFNQRAQISATLDTSAPPVVPSTPAPNSAQQTPVSRPVIEEIEPAVPEGPKPKSILKKAQSSTSTA